MNIDFEKYVDLGPDSSGLKIFKEDNFLPHCIPMLASIPLVRNENNKISVLETMQKCKTLDIVSTPNGKTTGANLVNLVKFLHNQNRSVLMKSASTKNPTYGSLTPMLLYAHKLHHNVKYEEWDKKDPGIHVALGKALSPILEIDHHPKWTKDLSQLNQIRREYSIYKSGKKKGTICPYHGYKGTKLSIPLDDDENLCDFVEKNTTYPIIVSSIYLQLWIAHSSLRVPGVMILDPLDWDNVPKALDEIEIARSVVKKAVKKVSEELPF